MATALKAKEKIHTRPMSFSIRTDILDDLSAYCAERGCSRSWFMTKALENYLKECKEDKEDYETAAAALAEFEKGDGKTYSLDEVRKELGL